MTSGLVAECLDALSVLPSMNEVTLIWVPGHCGILGNEEADKLARQVSAVHCFVQSRLCVQQEKQLKTGLSINIIAPGENCQVLNMGSFL